MLWLLSFLQTLTWLSVVAGRNLHKSNEDDAMMIPFELPPRHDLPHKVELYPVRNRVYVHTKCGHERYCPDFHIASYFEDEFEMTIVIRRLDAVGWTTNITIGLESVDAPAFGRRVKEFFSVAACNDCHRHVERIHTNVVLERGQDIDKKQTIPKVIIRTYRTNAISSLFHLNAHQTFVDLNPEYQVNMFTDRDCRLFLKKYFSPSVVEAYDVLIAPSFKADVFRYAYLALRGGCYFDHKMILRRPLRSVISANDSLLVCSDALSPSGHAASHLSSTSQFYNAVMCSSASNMHFMFVLFHVVTSIRQRIITERDLGITGPAALYRALMMLSSQQSSQRTLWGLSSLLSSGSSSNDLLDDDSILDYLLQPAAREEFFPKRQNKRTYMQTLASVNDSNVRFKHGIHHKGYLDREYRDYYVKEKVTGRVFLHKFYPYFSHMANTTVAAKALTWTNVSLLSSSNISLAFLDGSSRRDLSRYSHLWQEKLVYYERLGMFGRFKLLGFPGTRRNVHVVSAVHCHSAHRTHGPSPSPQDKDNDHSTDYFSSPKLALIQFPNDFRGPDRKDIVGLVEVPSQWVSPVMVCPALSTLRLEQAGLDNSALSLLLVRVMCSSTKVPTTLQIIDDLHSAVYFVDIFSRCPHDSKRHFMRYVYPSLPQYFGLLLP